MNTTDEIRNQVISLVRNFVKKDVLPVARKYEYEDNYPHELIEKMKEMGLFGITIPESYGGMGFDYTTFATIFEELSKGWMSLTGPIGTHHVLANIIEKYLLNHFEDCNTTLPPPGLYFRILEKLEKPLISITLKATQGNQVRAANILGINRNTLRKKMRELDIVFIKETI